MKDINRRDFLKKGAVLGATSFVVVNGILVPRESQGATFPILGIIATSLLQVLTAYLSARNSYKLSAFNEIYRPYDQETSNYFRLGTNYGNIKKKSLYSGNTAKPINNFQDKYDDITLSLIDGNAYMDNGYQKGIYDPTELRVAHRYHEQTGYHLFPNENIKTGYYRDVEGKERDFIRNYVKSKKEFRDLGELGSDYGIYGIRNFKDDRGKLQPVVKFKRDHDDRLHTAIIEV